MKPASEVVSKTLSYNLEYIDDEVNSSSPLNGVAITRPKLPVDLVGRSHGRTDATNGRAKCERRVASRPAVRQHASSTNSGRTDGRTDGELATKVASGICHALHCARVCVVVVADSRRIIKKNEFNF